MPLNIELSINRRWPRPKYCHCCDHVRYGPVVKPEAQVNGAVQRLPLQIAVGDCSTDWPRTFDHPLFPIISMAKRYRSTCGFPHNVGFNVVPPPLRRVQVTQRTLMSNKDRWRWRSLVMNHFTSCVTITVELVPVHPARQPVGKTAMSCDSGTASCRPTLQRSANV